MDEQRNKLIKLLYEVGDNILSFPIENFHEALADFLLSNGVIVSSVKLGQMVYSIVNGIIHPLEGPVYEITFNRNGFVYQSARKGYLTLAFTDEDIGKTVFFTREEAHEAIAKRSKK